MSNKLLDKINYPSDLRKFKKSELKTISDELRNELIEVVSETGGHLGASLESLNSLLLCITYLIHQRINLFGT